MPWYRESDSEQQASRRMESTYGGRLWDREHREAAERRKMQVHLQREGRSKRTTTFLREGSKKHWAKSRLDRWRGHAWRK